jgi:hypothetical protein
MGIKMPSHLRIGPVTYEVAEEVDPRDGEGDAVWGAIRHTTFELVVDQEMTVERKAITVIHEALHAILEQGSAKQDERAITVMGYGLYGLIRDNREFIRWIQEL